MSRLLQLAIAKLQKLPVSEQDAFAQFILKEIAEEDSWRSAFANSHNELSLIAKKVRDDIRCGRVLDLGIDEL